MITGEKNQNLTRVNLSIFARTKTSHTIHQETSNITKVNNSTTFKNIYVVEYPKKHALNRKIIYTGRMVTMNQEYYQIEARVLSRTNVQNYCPNARKTKFFRYQIYKIFTYLFKPFSHFLQKTHSREKKKKEKFHPIIASHEHPGFSSSCFGPSSHGAWSKTLDLVRDEVAWSGNLSPMIVCCVKENDTS